MLKKIYGEKGTALYGIAFSYTGVSSLMILFLQAYWLNSESVASYNGLFYVCGVLSLASFAIVVSIFTEDKFISERSKKAWNAAEYNGESKECVLA